MYNVCADSGHLFLGDHRWFVFAVHMVLVISPWTPISYIIISLPCSWAWTTYMVGKACRVRGDDELLIAVMSHFQPNDGVAIYYGASASVLDFILIYIFTTSKPSCQCAEAKKSLLRRPMKMSVRLRGGSRVTPPPTMFKSPPSIRSKRPRIQKYVDQFSFSIYTWYIYIITD